VKVELTGAGDLAKAAKLTKVPVDRANSGRAHRQRVRPQTYCLCGKCEECEGFERERLLREARAAKWGCRCGHPNCDCARWDEIYKAKFEDPGYYTRRREITLQSCLGNMALPDVGGAKLKAEEGAQDADPDAMRKQNAAESRRWMARFFPHRKHLDPPRAA
jgi:hypothetical protein